MAAGAVARQALQHLAIGQHAADHRVSSSSSQVKGLTQVQGADDSITASAAAAAPVIR